MRCEDKLFLSRRSQLRGYDRDEVQAELADTDYLGDLSIEKHAFLFGTIAGIHVEKDTFEIKVDLGDNLAPGFIDREGLARVVEARVKWQQSRWSEVSDPDYHDLITQLQEKGQNLGEYQRYCRRWENRTGA